MTQQCFMGVGNAVRDSVLSGAAVDAYLLAARAKLNSGALCLSVVVCCLMRARSGGHVIADVTAQGLIEAPLLCKRCGGSHCFGA